MLKFIFLWLLLFLNFPTFASSKNLQKKEWTIEYIENLNPLKDETFHILISQWTVGQTKPCSCSLASYGGLEARERELEIVKKKYPNLVVLDAGNTFFPDSEIIKKYPENFKNSDPMKIAKLLVKKYEDWGVKAVALGHHETDKEFQKTIQLFGKKAPKFKLLSSLEEMSSIASSYTDIEIANTKVRLISFGKKEIASVNAAEIIQKNISPNYLNILIGDATYTELKNFNEKIKLPHELLYLGSGNDIELYKPVKIGKITQLGGTSRKQNWLMIKIAIDNKKNKLLVDSKSISTWAKP